MPVLTRILLVDDDPDIQVIARVALEVIGGFTVITCGSGAEASQTAPVFAPDLILLDVMMPGMDGPSTLKALRALPLTTITPIIFVTAKTQAYDIAQYRALGVLDVITKPFNPMTFAAMLRTIWLRKDGSGMV